MEFRYAQLPGGVDFGSRDTEISKAVRKRKAQLATRLAAKENACGDDDDGATAASAEIVPWSLLTARFRRRVEEKAAESGFLQRLACENSCWRCLRRYWEGDRPALPSDDDAAADKVNAFSAEERKQLLHALWGEHNAASSGVSATAHADVRTAAHRYARHMALSNTVRPYDKGGVLCFQVGLFSLAELNHCSPLPSLPNLHCSLFSSFPSLTFPYLPLPYLTLPYFTLPLPYLTLPFLSFPFQAESAEELAMVEFARDCGFTKLSVNPTVLRVQAYTFDGNGDAHEAAATTETYRHLATLGFTSARARVSVVYQRVSRVDAANAPLPDDDEGGAGFVHVMTKGQDTVVMPLIRGMDTDAEDALLGELQTMCANGLRTLVGAWSTMPVAWWDERAAAYKRVTTADESPASKGHSSGDCDSQRCEKCDMHSTFAEFEDSAQLRYMGCIGLEDQLQDFVPEAIQNFLRASIRVWMITGDKLETAKNIGMACNLIDADMQPSLNLDMRMDDRQMIRKCIEEFQTSRLLEVTGQWSKVLDDEEELVKLFGTFDLEKKGAIDVSTLDFVLQALNFKMEPERLNMFMSVGSSEGGDGDDGKKTINVKQFVTLMRSCELSMYEAVLHDIDEGIKRFNAIDDHQAYPVSILLNADAFHVLFPDGVKRKKKTTDKAGALTGLTRRKIKELIADGERGLKMLAHQVEKMGDVVGGQLLKVKNAIVKSDGSGKAKKTGSDSNDSTPASSPHPSRNPSRSPSVAESVASSINGGSCNGPTEEQLEELRRKFFLLTSVAKSVVFARAQPAMKKRIVTEIRARQPEAITLAVGDGANDADMIRAAHVGVGIAGVEGTAASNSADYAIGTFRLLHKLVFVHGYLSYQRVSILVLFIMYKCSLVSLTAYYFGFFSGFSGQQFFNDPSYQLYNILFTALPIIIVAIFNQPLPPQVLEDNPLAYRAQRGTQFSSKAFTRWVKRVFLHSLMLYFIPMFCLAGRFEVASDTGHTTGMWAVSTATFVCLVLLVTCILVFEMATITLLHTAVTVASLCSLFLFMAILSSMQVLNPDLYGVVFEFVGQPRIWFIIGFTVSLPLIIELAWRGLRAHLRPTMSQVILERLRMKDQSFGEFDNEMDAGGSIIVEPSSALAAPRGSVIDFRSSSPVSRSAKSKSKSHNGRKGSSGQTLGMPLLEDEKDSRTWDTRRAGKMEKTHQLAAEAAQHLRAFAAPAVGDIAAGDGADPAVLRGAVIRAMLKFRNLTGAQFDSAAEAKFQQHDEQV
jgi:magnesium-transporting ATPase (P-type)